MKHKETILFGTHPVHEAIKSGKQIDKIFLKQGFRNETIPGLFSILRDRNIPFQYVPVEKLNRLTAKNHQGIIAIVSELEYTELDKLIPFLFEQGKTPALVLLDGITDVRNMGAIARSAECAGIDGIVIPSKGSAQINSEAIKTSAGALSIIPVCRVNNLADAVKYLRECGLQIIAATEKADGVLYEADFRQPTAIIMGSEDTGIDARLIKSADKLVKIPLFGKIQSLNVSSAATVLFFEMVRQRRS
ncbi:MAG TPA: 23S rRNA (guanosine(2251)-2'-O)-methyltransferase RlmB [Bacteroidales bacterium]|jgi:23S rRNA (guanosine2251-2'-O)-methyltransferase|nr:23S rRNA (guanosine(2251)-2'-O)-methyltransferase RlmB [Bacteroidales bacterium]